MHGLNIAAIRKYSSHYAKRVHQLIKKKLAKVYHIARSILEARPSDWSELPNDTLGLISERLNSFKDQIRFRAVCKSWRLVTHGIRSDHKLPWLLVLKDWKYSQEPSHHLLYNPWSQEEYLVANKRKSVVKKAVAAKSGWVIIRNCGCQKILLYCPFTQETVRLPRIRGIRLWIPFTLTYCPKARSFAVYGAMITTEGTADPSRPILVVSWRSGDKGWEFHHVTLEPCYRGDSLDSSRIRSLHCVEGVLYCAFSSGLVGRFDFSGQKHWRIVAGAKEFSDPSDVVVCEGEIYLVSTSDYLLSRAEIFRLDLSKKIWVEESSLGEKVLFYSPIDGFSVMVWVGDDQSTKELVGRMYYYHPDDESCHYRVHGGEWVVDKDDSTYAFPCPVEHLSEMTGGSSFNPAMWIEHPN